MDRYLDLTKQGNGQGGILVDIGSYQHDFHGKVLPIITVEKAKEIFTAYLNGQHVCLKWNIYNALFNYLNVVSADHVNNEYSIDVLVHNRYHVGYTWVDEQEGLVTIEVEEFPVDIIQNFLPDGTVITVKQDGTGDFTDIQTAISSLDGKYSNGIVTVEIGEGNWNVPSHTIKINNLNCKLHIKGKGIDTTNLLCSNDIDYLFEINKSVITFSNFTAKSTNTTTPSSDNPRFIRCYENSDIKITNCKFSYLGQGVVCSSCSTIFLENNTANNCRYLYENWGGNLYISGTNTVSNTIFFTRVISGGITRFYNFTKQFSSVTNTTNQTIGNITTEGIIIGQVS